MQLQNVDSQYDISNKTEYKIMIVAGESSSDQHAASLIKAIKGIHPRVKVIGMGGSHLRSVGMKTIVDTEQVGSIMGIAELYGGISKIVSSYKSLLKTAREEKPDLLILVDFPDFNLRLASALQKERNLYGMKIMYYICPQIWAWRRGRIKTIRKLIDKVAAIFPFEDAFYHQHGVDVEYVGHPLLDRSFEHVNSRDWLLFQGLDPERPVIALLPGSRKSEVQRLLPSMSDAFNRISKYRTNLQGVIPVPNTLEIEWVKSFLPKSSNIKLIEGQASELLAVSTVGVIASGTATMEAALAELPFIAVYRFTPFSYFIARLLVRGVKQFSMPNLILGDSVVPELLQDEVTGDRICNELENLLGDPGRYNNLKKKLSQVRSALTYKALEHNTKSTSERAAYIALNLIESKR
jgi:lipid-A-disaccharide synthase